MSGKEMKEYRKNFQKGEVLLQQGEEGTHFYLIEEGILDVYIQDRKVNTIDATVHQDFVGEIGAILGTPRTATVIAATDCVALCLPRLELESVLRDSPAIGIRLVHSLSKKLVNSSSALVEYQIENASVLLSGNTENSLRNYMKGLLHLIEGAAEDAAEDNGKKLLKYFLQTNPWGVQSGAPEHILTLGFPKQSLPVDTAEDGTPADGENNAQKKEE